MIAVHSNKFKLIILDECDAMTKDAQFALRRGALLQRWLRSGFQPLRAVCVRLLSKGC